MKLKQLFFVSAMVVIAVFCGSCGSSNAVVNVESSRTTTKSIEGSKVTSVQLETFGIEKAETLNAAGTDIIMMPYKWFLGIGESQDQQVAIEMAQREAYATISRVVVNGVKDEAERGVITVNDNVQRALNSHWAQFSTTLLKACAPFGKTEIQYDKTTKVYKAYAKVAVRGDKWNELLENAANFRPKDLTGEDLDNFIEINRAILDASKVQ